MSDFDQYQSPFSWRYGSAEMRHIWSETNKRRLWRLIWVKLAQVQQEYGLVNAVQLADLQSHVEQVDIPRALEIEAQIHHDLMAELKTFAEQSAVGGGSLHLGATSMDIEDNADALRLRQATWLLLQKLTRLLSAFAQKIEQYADTPVMGFTHLQPAEPTSLGYRLAFYAADLLEDWHNLDAFTRTIRGKGFKGAVGNAAAYIDLLGSENFAAFENTLSTLLDLPFFLVTNQTSPRTQEYDLLCQLARCGATIYKFAFDLRLLQSPVIGEVSEPFGRSQVGSSAMPFKRNPIQSEKIDSLARALAQMPVTAWNNAAHTLLERTLDDSANRRSLLPEAFLTCDELLITAEKIITRLDVRPQAIARNLDRYAAFAGMERILMALTRTGMDRQEMHEHLRGLAMQAWEEIQNGRPNPLAHLLSTDTLLNRYLRPNEIEALLSVQGYLGIAPQRARDIAQEIHRIIQGAAAA